MYFPNLPNGPDGTERQPETEKIGSAFLSFAFYGALTGFLIFFGLHFGLGLTEGWATLAAWVIGLSSGIWLASFKWTPKAGSALWGQYWNKRD